MTVKIIEKEMRRLSNKEKAKILANFFKTKKGQYGAGDKFLGITVPQQRIMAKKYYQSTNLKDIQKFLDNPHHELRLLGLIILTMQFVKANKNEQKNIYNFYLKNIIHINNWDLVDLSAPNIAGKWLLNHDRKILYKLAQSKNIWKRRIAIISTFAFIRTGQFNDTIKLAEILLTDKHDLIHKAVGWMLREVGKKNLTTLERFLKIHYKKIPRTTLRYAIEKFSKKKRKKYLKMTAR
ncbi:MAG: DNA alkylation repair protein [Candidatus Magasanikbacteria bacterium CG10_big_fil_rev_8_21_14_0_10_36_32]|uniref:DNA alkylation repair protein n=1 Tax=Candidatus Magasanikbacteria bacterium CG10_big_fil_rev_8_21_14_0_10_36_32 TaxID=1974646 RepID=A0A2M6W7A0_9BACT|nr:MAG: DNA alkylation repair protein [Candidatus Magasanikbacteria bacterium CG10_big_fil_rev_8_21_14_0_10_36_32]